MPRTKGSKNKNSKPVEKSMGLDIVEKEIAPIKKEIAFFQINKKICIPFSRISNKTFFVGDKIPIEERAMIEMLVDCGAFGEFV